MDYDPSHMSPVFHQAYKFSVVSGTKLGRACVATSDIQKGEIICKMTGPSISLREFFDKYELNDCNPLQVSADEYIDLVEPYVCFNHSCDPNAALRNEGILFALRMIKKDEEIMYDYSTSVDDPIWHMGCLCGTKNCRKLIADFQSIPHEQKEFYRINNAITRHIHNLYY